MCDLTEGCVLVFNHSVNCVRFFATPQTLARQAPLSVEFSRQKYWSGLPFLLQGDPLDPRTEPMSPMSPALAGNFFTNCRELVFV